MARKPRIHYPGAIYHVIARGNNKENIFLDSKDKNRYHDLLDKYKLKYNFEIYAYVLMDNHVHLLVCVNEVPLAKIMQGIQLSYTQYYNKKYQHFGHVFQQRYKAFLCNSDSYLLNLICYIHQNPCRAHFPEGLVYTWSSHKDYLAGQGRCVNPLVILSMFSEEIKQAIQCYTNLVLQEQKDPVEVIKSFEIESLEFDSIDNANKQSLNERVFTVEQPSFNKIANCIAEEMQIPLEQLLGRCRIRKVVEARNLLIYRVLEANLFTRAELAAKLGLDPAIITRGYQQIRNTISQ